MAVYTKFEDADFITILSQFDIGNFVAAIGIAEGVENTNYLVTTTQNKYILTVYEERMNEAELPFFVELMQKLSLQNIPCPEPIFSKQNQAILKYNGKFLTIVSFLQGKSPSLIKNNHVELIGQYLAKIHNASGQVNLKRENSLSLDFWQKSITLLDQKADANFTSITAKIKSAFANIQNNWPKNLPAGIIHADLFPDNVFFDEGKNQNLNTSESPPEVLSAILDFYMACNDIFAYDIAITLNAWCFESDYSFNITKASRLLNAYNNVRQLTEAEKQALPLLCSGAALRFLLTRLHAYLNQVEGALVKVKNPVEYLKRMEFHSQIKSYTEYGL
jgi:homoserine kinase type II